MLAGFLLLLLLLVLLCTEKVIFNMNRYQKHNNISRSYISMSLFRYATNGRDITAMCMMSI